MKKKVIFVLLVFLMFLAPFMIIAGHFKNMLKGMVIGTTLHMLDLNVSNIAVHSSKILENEYSIFYDIDTKNLSLNEISSVLKRKRKEILRGYAVYDEKMRVILKDDRQQISSEVSKNLLSVAKNSKLPVGYVEYPSDMPPILTMALKIPSYYIIWRGDLGYMIADIMKITEKSNAKIYLIDGDYNIIYDSSQDYLFNKTVVPKEIVNIINNLVNSLRTSYRGIVKVGSFDYMVSIRNIEHTKWWVFGMIKLDDATDPYLSRWANRVIIIGVILIFVFSIITFVMARKLL